MSKNKKLILDEFFYHEALDRTYLITNNIDHFLIKHPVFKKHNNIKKRTKKALKLLFETYQIIGAMETKINKK